MSELATSRTDVSLGSRGSWWDRNYFLLRRLHSLTGVAPIGIFLIFHLTTNSSILWGMLDPRKAEYGHAGVASYQSEVNFIHSTPFLLLVEIFVLWLPIAFHSVLGVYYARTGRHNLHRYSYQDNWRYSWQRWSGYVALAFIVYHVATLRWGVTWLLPSGTKWDHNFAASTMAEVLRGGSEGITLGGVLVSAFYMVGVTASVFHFANGLWTAAITWGLTISQSAQRRWGHACLGLGAAMMVMGWSSVVGFLFLDPDRARATEMKLLGGEPTLPVQPGVLPAGGEDGLRVELAP